MFSHNEAKKSIQASNWEKEGNFTWHTPFDIPNYHCSFRKLSYRNKISGNELEFFMESEKHSGAKTKDILRNERLIRITLTADKMTKSDLDDIAKLCRDKKSFPYPDFMRGQGEAHLSFNSNDPRIIATFLNAVSSIDPISQADLDDIFKSLGLDYPMDLHLDMDTKDYHIYLLEGQIESLKSELEKAKKLSTSPLLRFGVATSCEEKATIEKSSTEVIRSPNIWINSF